MSKHYMGRWSVTGPTGHGGINIAAITDTGHHLPVGVVFGNPEGDSTKATARLFAKAPEMYELLERVRDGPLNSYEATQAAEFLLASIDDE